MKVFESIKAGLREAIAHQHGKAPGVKIHCIPHEPWLVGRLKSPKLAAAYLEAALEDGDQGGVMLALRHVAKAQGLLLSVKPVERKLAKAA